MHGDVVRTARARGSEASLHHEMSAEQGFWLAVRAYGENHAIAHSAPVYVHVDDTGSWSASKAPALVTKMRERLTSLAETPIVPWRELEFWELGDDFEELWERQRSRIVERIAEANREYDALLTRIEGTK